MKKSHANHKSLHECAVMNKTDIAPIFIPCLWKLKRDPGNDTGYTCTLGTELDTYHFIQYSPHKSSILERQIDK